MVAHANIFYETLTGPLVRQPSLFKHFSHSDMHNEQTIIYKKKAI